MDAMQSFKKTLLQVLMCLIIVSYVQGMDSTSTVTPASVTPHNCSQKAVKKINHIEECTKESRVNRNYISKMKAGYWSLPQITTSVKYWAFCYLKRLNMMTEAGVLRQDVVLKNFSKKERRHIVKVIDKCLYSDAHLPMDTAWHYLSCFHKTNYKLSRRVHGI